MFITFSEQLSLVYFSKKKNHLILNNSLIACIIAQNDEKLARIKGLTKKEKSL